MPLLPPTLSTLRPVTAAMRSLAAAASFGLARLVATTVSPVALHRRFVANKYRFAGLRGELHECTAGRLFCYEGGEGPPLLLIHGFGFGALETWENQVGELARHHRLIVPDLFWFGRSQVRPGAGLETAREQADALVELMDQLGVGRAHVVGMSFGGYVAMELARHHPGRVAGLILTNSAGLAPTADELDRVADSFPGASGIGDLLMPADTAALERFLRTIFYRPLYLPTFALMEVLQVFHEHREVRMRILQGVAPDGGGDTAHLLKVADLAGIRARTLVLWGRHDPLIHDSLGRRLAAAIPGAEVRFFEESGHCPMLEEPDRFNREVMSFLGSAS